MRKSTEETTKSKNKRNGKLKGMSFLKQRKIMMIHVPETMKIQPIWSDQLQQTIEISELLLIFWVLTENSTEFKPC